MLKKTSLLMSGLAFVAFASAAFGAQLAVEVSQAADSDNIYSRVGIISEDGSIDWGNKIKAGSGKSPCVTAEGSVAVLVYLNEKKGELVYQVGDVDPDRVRVDWGPAVSYGGGRRPFFSLHNGQLIEVHQGKNKDKLFCQIGDVDTKRQQITFSAATSYDEQGRSPSIALSDK